MGNPFRLLPVKNGDRLKIPFMVNDDTLDVYAFGHTIDKKWYLYTIYPVGTVGEMRLEDIVLWALRERIIVVPSVNY